MNPYILNPYAIAAANLKYAQAVAAAQANGHPPPPPPVQSHSQQTAQSTAAAINPYAAAIAANPALAQAAALNAYTQNMNAMAMNNMVQLNAMNNAMIGNPNESILTVDHDNGDDNNNEDENGQMHKKNHLKVEHDGFYNMKPLLAENILASDYFKSLFRLKTYHEVIDEIQRHCRNVEPLMVGLSRKPSTAFCILYKFFSMELTVRQVQGLLDYLDNAFVRCLGFLYLRYILPGKDLWKFFSPYFDDEQEFSPGADGKVIKMKEFVSNLLIIQKYFSTLLPRIPVKIERAYKKRLLQHQLIRKRDAENETFRDKLYADMQIRAQWQDLKWYDAVIVQCLDDGTFRVNFTEYDDECDISIGQIQLKKNKKTKRHYSRSRTRSRSRSRSVSNDRKNRKYRKRKRSVSESEEERDRDRSRSRHRSSRHHRSDRSDRSHRRRRDRDYRRERRRDTHKKSESEWSGEDENEYDDDKELEEMVRKQEMEASVAIGRDYARRPTAYYHSLTLDLETGTNRKRSPSPQPIRRKKKVKSKEDEKKKSVVAPVNKLPSKEHLEKMRKLKLRYGDASKS